MGQKRLLEENVVACATCVAVRSNEPKMSGSLLLSQVHIVWTPCRRAARTCRAPGIPCMFGGHARMVRSVARLYATFARVKHSWSQSRLRHSPLRKVDTP